MDPTPPERRSTMEHERDAAQMTTIYCVCAWDTYYPQGGTGNILAAFQSREKSEEFLAIMRQEGVIDLLPFNEHVEIIALEVAP